MPDLFIEKMQGTLGHENPNVSVTENGAVGYKTAGNALLDLNFRLSSMRNMDENEIWIHYLKAYNEHPVLALVWLFFARDVRQGCGERRVFRVIMDRLAKENPALVENLLPLIPKYGRWDDLLEIFCSNAPQNVRDAALSVFKEQLGRDIIDAGNNKPVSLLAKWTYSIVTTSAETRRKAEKLRTALGFTPKQYRKIFAGLRKHIGVVEQQMSGNNWSEIHYEYVPSSAGIKYRNAFARHDADRFNKYLTDVSNGKAKMHAEAVFPYEIVHAYMDRYGDTTKKDYDETLELKWKNLPNTVPRDNGTLVVVDGSGSMSMCIGGTRVTCQDVARSLGIYFAERLPGAYHNRFITFSENPKIVTFDGASSLKSKLDILISEDECSNTNIERTFDLILKTAVDNHLKQEGIPANILVVSDMEFDEATGGCYGLYDCPKTDQSLFDSIAKRWLAAGYKLPRLVFWNVCSRTGTIPVKENELGVALVSGFSPMIADMVMSGETDPYKILVDKLHSERYQPVWKVVMPS